MDNWEGSLILKTLRVIHLVQTDQISQSFPNGSTKLGLGIQVSEPVEAFLIKPLHLWSFIYTTELKEQKYL